MPNKTQRVMGIDGVPYSVILVDSGTVDANGNPLFRLAVDCILDVGDIEMGKVKLLDAAGTNVAKIAALSGLASTDLGLPVAALLMPGSSSVGNVGRIATTVTPTGQNSTNTPTRVTGADLDTLHNLSASFTVKNTAGVNSINFDVRGGNMADFSDAVIVQVAQTVLAGAYGTFAAAATPFIYYGVFIVSTVPGAAGTALVFGITKG